MKSLKLVDESFVIDRSRVFLYYDRFRYRVKIPLDNIQYFRHVKSVERLWEQLGNIASWRNLQLKTMNIYGVKRFVQWTENNQSSKDQYTCRISTNSVDVYTNDIELIRDLLDSVTDEKNKIGYQLYRVIDQPKTDRTKIYLVDPQYRYRMYFKWAKLSTEQIQNFLEFINNYDISCSSSLKSWIENQSWESSYYYIWDNFFIEFNEDMIITVASLKFDNIFRKICTVEKR